MGALIFQNKKELANQRLTEMLEAYEHHSVTDEIYWSKSKLELESGNTQKSIEYLDEILASYSYDILADDAAFKKAEIVERFLKDVEQAKTLYQQFYILPNSIILLTDTRTIFNFNFLL